MGHESCQECASVDAPLRQRRATPRALGASSRWRPRPGRPRGRLRPRSPSKLTVVLRRVRPRTIAGSVRLGPSTRTSSTRPIRSALRSAATRCTRSTSASSLACLTSSGTGLGKRSRLRPASRRVDERECAVEPNRVDQRQRLLEVVLGLAGESHDEIGTQRQIRNGVAQRVHEPEIAIAVVRATHCLQDARRAGLRWQVNVLADARALGHCRDDGRAEVLGMRAREPDPVDAVHGVARPQQLAELGVDVGTKVTTPGVDVLAEQRDLPDAGIGEPRDLGEDVPRPPTLLAAANSGDDAVRARGVASHRDLHPGLEASLAVDRKVRREVLVRPEPSTIDRVATRRDPVAEMRNRARPECDVDERIPLEDAFALRFGVAASDSDDEIGPLALHRAGIPQVARRAACPASRGWCTC